LQVNTWWASVSTFYFAYIQLWYPVCTGRGGRNILVGTGVRPGRRIWDGNYVSFGIYIVGFLILIGGLIYGAVILHIAAHWIAVGAIVLLGLAIVKGVQATRGKDPPQ
jgi:hypothetical protein